MKRLCTAGSQEGSSKTFKSGLSLMGAAFIAVLAVIMLCGTGGQAFADNATAAGVVSAGADGSTSIDVKMPYTGDANGNSAYTVQWKLCTAGSYAPADTINGTHTASPYTTTITGLTPNTCYNIKTAFIDADGVTGTNPREIKITSTSDNTLLHNVNRFSGSTKWSGNWGLTGGKYGQIDCETCHTPRTTNIKGISGVITSPNSPAESFPGGVVLFQSTTTPDGFGDDTDGHTSSTKVCEVCHTVTNYHRYNTSGQIAQTHNNNLDCMACHPHAAGFSNVNDDCKSCHGNPPTADSFGGPSGLASSPVTGSTTAGSHSFHATSAGRNFDCAVCHYNSVGSGATHRDGKISLGFVNLLGAGTYSTGTYDGQTAANYEATDGGTSATKGGTKSCSNIYCHGTTMAPNGGTNTTPVWGDNSTGVCGTCHGATAATPPTKGSHAKHAGSAGGGRALPCDECHHGKTPIAIPSGLATHVNNKADFAFDAAKTYIGSAAYSGDDTMLNAYGTCSNLYCHSNVQGASGTGNPTVYATVTWGGSATNCGSCHADMATDIGAATGLHKTHANTATGNGYVCNTCHNNAGAGTTKHADHTIDVSFSAGGTYSQGGATGDGYGTCSTVACHSDGNGNYSVVNWGAAQGSAGCTTCHGAPPATGAHLAHIQNAALLSGVYGSTEVVSTTGEYIFGCGNCHPTTLANHRNGSVEIVLAGTGPLGSLNAAGATYNAVTKKCSGVYCHSNGASVANRTFAVTPAWDTHLPTANKCGQCHDNPPQYEGQSHYTATNYMGAEGGHFVGIHQDDIYTGTKGLSPAGTDGMSSHGNPATSTTMSCYICHNTVVSSVPTEIDTYSLSNLSVNSDLKCNKCHTDITPTPLRNGVIANKNLHVNGVKDVSLADNFTVKTKAQLREGSVLTVWQRSGTYKTSGSYDYATIQTSDYSKAGDGTITCTTACHNKNAVTWGSPNASCVLCHSL
ncbi:MAG: CxxxxCH/CxxCH domain-containing protein [Thermodesulfovibrionales bacterium]